MELQERLEKAMLVRDAYPRFVPFLEDAMTFLGFSTTWMQKDIAEFMETGPAYLMVQAQRSEAKSTIACIFGIWCLIQWPWFRVLLVSGNQGKANENGMLMHGLVYNWELLDFLIPDPSRKQRTSTTEFDVHWALKGVNKSASVNCVSVTGGLQGLRSDLLIPDDVETTKNGLTATGREGLIRQCVEFSSIDDHGRILYLGTPQSKDSTYNTLARRGYEVRIWPGRFPSKEQQEHYGPHLAPSIVHRMAVLGDSCRTGCGLDGTLGKATDPDRLNDEDLIAKELEQGPENFQLQFMLDTHLMDAMRTQIRLRDFIVGDFDSKSVPESFNWAPHKHLAVEMRHEAFNNGELDMYYAASHSPVFGEPSQRTMVIDPAGDGGDELSFAIGGALGPYLHVMGLGGLRGGFSEENLQTLCDLALEFDVKCVNVEKNMGAGAVGLLIQNYFNGNDPKTGKPRAPGIGWEDVPSGNLQKERRIIDTVRPVVQQHRIVLHKRAIEMDVEYMMQYPIDRRTKYSCLYQLANITYDKGCLEKDDRADAIEQLVRALAGHLAVDEDRASEQRRVAAAKAYIADPMGYGKKFNKPTRGRHRAARKRYGG